MAWGGRKYNTNGGGGSGTGSGRKFGGNSGDGAGEGDGNNRGGFKGRNSGQQSAPRGNGRKFGRNQGGNDEFETITSLFLSKSGNAFTVYLKPDMLEILHSLQGGDMLGVNPSQKDESRFTFWVKRADQSGQGQDDQGQS